MNRLADAAMRAIGAGAWAKAESALRQLVKLRGAPAEASYNLAQVLLRNGKAEQAGHWLRRALAAKPDYAAAWFELGRWLVERGELDEARDAFAQATAHTPDDGDAWRNLARVAERLGDYATARDAWRHLGDSEARIGLLRALLEMRDPAADTLRTELWAEPALRPALIKAITRVSAGTLPLRP